MYMYAAASVCFFLPFVFCGLWFANDYIHQLEYITFKMKTSFSKNSNNNKQVTAIHMHTCMQWLNPWICVLDLLGDTVFSFVLPAILTMLLTGIHWSVHEIGDGASNYPFCTCSRLWPDPDRESLNTIDWLYTPSLCEENWNGINTVPNANSSYSEVRCYYVLPWSCTKLTFSGQLLSLFGSPFNARDCDVKQFH